MASAIPSMSWARVMSERTETSVSTVGPSSRPPGRLALLIARALKMSGIVAVVDIMRIGSG